MRLVGPVHDGLPKPGGMSQIVPEAEAGGLTDSPPDMAEILDACCGGRHWWWDKAHPLAVYMDERRAARGTIDVRPEWECEPDLIGDFREMPFDDGTFQLVLFDPPHITREGLHPRGYIPLKYGALFVETEQDDLRRGFAECWRVLASGGTLVFKWGANSIDRVEPYFPATPIVGTRSPRGGQTRWFIFYKPLARGGDAVGASRVLAGSESPPKTISAVASHPVDAVASPIYAGDWPEDADDYQRWLASHQEGTS